MWFNCDQGSASLRGVKETIDQKLAGRTQIDAIDKRFFIDKTWIHLCAHRLLSLTQAITSIVRFLILGGDKIAADILCSKWVLVLVKYGLSFVRIYFLNQRRTTHRDEEMISKNMFLILTSGQLSQSCFYIPFLTLIARHACVAQWNTSPKYSSLVRVCWLSAAPHCHNMSAFEFACESQHTLVWSLLRV